MDNRLNILFAAPGYEPAWGLGGVVVALSTLARAIVDAGHHVTVYTTNGDGLGGFLDVPVGQPVDVGGVCVYYYQPTFGSSLFDSRDLRKAVQRAASQFDIIYLAATWQWIGIKIPSLAAKFNVPVVMFASGGFDTLHFSEKKIKKTIWFEFLLKKSLSHCKAIHLASPYEREQSKKRIAPWKNFIVPHCIDTGQFQYISSASQSIHQTYKIKEEIPLLLAVGRIDVNKRLDLLFKALKELNGTYDFHLLIVGQADNPLAMEYKQLCIDLGLNEQVTWTGLVPAHAMPEYYSASDLLVHLSVDENFGMVVIEAMSCDTPILVTPGVGVWHLVSDESVGKCVALDSKSVSDGLIDFFENQDIWQHWGKVASTVSRRRFSPNQIAETMIQAFRDILAGEFSSGCDWYLPEDQNKE